MKTDEEIRDWLASYCTQDLWDQVMDAKVAGEPIMIVDTNQLMRILETESIYIKVISEALSNLTKSVAQRDGIDIEGLANHQAWHKLGVSDESGQLLTERDND